VQSVSGFELLSTCWLACGSCAHDCICATDITLHAPSQLHDAPDHDHLHIGHVIRGQRQCMYMTQCKHDSTCASRSKELCAINWNVHHTQKLCTSTLLPRHCPACDTDSSCENTVASTVEQAAAATASTTRRASCVRCHILSLTRHASTILPFSFAAIVLEMITFGTWQTPRPECQTCKRSWNRFFMKSCQKKLKTVADRDVTIFGSHGGRC